MSLSNVYHQGGMLHSALIAGGAALQLSPDLVIVHFTLANVYTTMVIEHYYSYKYLFLRVTIVEQCNSTIQHCHYRRILNRLLKEFEQSIVIRDECRQRSQTKQFYIGNMLILYYTG